MSALAVPIITPVQGVQTAPQTGGSLTALPGPWLIGVLHLPALPGAPRSRTPVSAIAARAADEARLLADHGFSAVMVENFHDTPFPPGAAAPETVAALAVVTAAVVAAVSVPVGVNVLRNDGLSALGVAVAAGASFVRVNVLAGAAVTDQGLVQGQADVLLRRRAALGADHVAILADVDVKHATSLDTRPLPVRAADLAARSGADAVLVTGDATGHAVDLAQLDAVRGAVTPVPVLAASGTTAERLSEVLQHGDGAIVGTALKDPATGHVDPERVAAFAQRPAP